MPGFSKNVKLVIFSYFTPNEMLCKLSKLNHETRQLFSDNKESSILDINCLNLQAQDNLIVNDESYLINFAPLINLTLKSAGLSLN